MSATMNINGRSFNFTDGSNISIVNGVVMVDGVQIAADPKLKNIGITINGNVGSIVCDGSVSADAVNGDVRAGGSITCDNVGGNVNAGGSVNCDSVRGNVTAGGSIRM